MATSEVEQQAWYNALLEFQEAQVWSGWRGFGGRVWMVMDLVYL